MIDTHAHIYASEFDNDRDEVVERALTQGITKILLPNIDLDSIEPMLQTEAAYPEVCHSMMGLHPCYVDSNVDQTLEIVRDWFENTTLSPWAKSASTCIGIKPTEQSKRWLS